MSLVPWAFGMDPFFGDLGLGSPPLFPSHTQSGRRSVLPSGAAASTALAPMDDRQLLDFGRLASDPLPVDVEDRENEYLVRVHQREAGMRKKDLRVDVEHGMLTVRGERESESGDATQGHYTRRFRSVTRSMALPENVDENKIEARYEGNNLVIHIPKTGATGGRRSIQIGGGMGMGQEQAEHKQAEKPIGQGQGHGQGQVHQATHAQGQGQGATHAQGQTQGQTQGHHA